MTEREGIVAVLKANDIDPDQITANGQTAYERLEAAVMATVEAIVDGE